MKLIPSIDLKNGLCVRLKKGDFEQVTYYSQDPFDVVKDYEKSGVETLHIVDLDGAKNETMSQLDLILQLKNSTTLNFQVGGGIRTETAISQLLEGGIHKVVLGSLAIKKPDVTQAFLKKFGGQHFVLAFDIKFSQNAQPMIAIAGWQKTSHQTLWQALDSYNASGCEEFLCTDIDKDGMLSGPNVELYAQCLARSPDKKFQASGGVRHVEDLKALANAGLSSAIIGKALFENKLILAEALNEVAPC